MINYIKKYKQRYATNINFEKSDYDRFKKHLPKNVSLSDEINRFVSERGLQLEQEAATKLVEDTIKNTTLDKFIQVPEDDSKRYKNMYNMSKEELMDYGKFIKNHMTEISSIMWSRHKVTCFLGIPLDVKVAERARNVIYGDI